MARTQKSPTTNLNTIHDSDLLLVETLRLQVQQDEANLKRNKEILINAEANLKVMLKAPHSFDGVMSAAVEEIVASTGRSSPPWKGLYCDHMTQEHGQDQKEIEAAMKALYPAKPTYGEIIVIKQGD